MSDLHIIGGGKPTIVTPGGEQLAEEVNPQDVVMFMQAKAVAFDALFYLLCYNDKTGKFEFPKNKSMFKNKEYNEVLSHFKNGILQLQDGPTAAKFKSNMESYIAFLINNLEDRKKSL